MGSTLAFRRLLLVSFSLATLCSVCSCSSARRLLDAKPTTLSPFVEDRARFRFEENGPFHRVWASAPRPVLIEAEKRTEIYIAPVDTRGLRPIRQKLVRANMEKYGKQRPVGELAQRLRSQFVREFQGSRSRYRVVPRPTNSSVTLQLCLVEIDPTSVPGNIAKKAAGFKIGLLAGFAGRWTKGSVAIEGKLWDSRSRALVFQFADREHDKITYWNLRDFRPYGHCQVAFVEWARQFERLTRTPGWRRRIGDASLFTLSPL